MDDIKRTAIVIAALAVLLLISSSFVGSNIMNRAIIIGVGVDKLEDGVRLTAEIVSPGNGSEQVGTYSKIVSANGRSVGQAIQKIAELTGKEASLGRCLLIILGQDFYENTDFADTIDYFINSDSFKESSAICCCEGSAEELMNKGPAVAQSVSLALTTLLQDQAKKVAIVTNTLLDYTLSQKNMLKTGFLNKVKFLPSQNTDSNKPDQEQGFFTINDLTVFRDNNFDCDLTPDESIGLALFNDKVLGDTFSSDASGKLLTVNVNSKKIDKKIKDGEVTITIKLFVKLARTDSADVEGVFVSQDKKEIPKETINDITEQARQLSQAVINRQISQNFDLIKIHDLYRQKQGSNKELENKPMEEFNVNLKVEVIEK